MKWLEYSQIGSSETTTVIFDSHWLDIIVHCVGGCIVLQNQHDASSTVSKRPDTILAINGALVLKGEAKYLATDLDIASDELTEKFHASAFKCFPSGCNRILGVTSAVGASRLYFIDYDGDGQYSCKLIKQYTLSLLHQRVLFLVDLFKLMRWMVCITGSNEKFHLTVGIRRETTNGHHVTWTKEGILKEFHHRTDFTKQLNFIQTIYSHRPRLLHVEYGYVINNSVPNSLMITRIGSKLNSANMSRYRLSRNDVLTQVRESLNELHGIGFAHCDLSIDNVFIDDDGVVFLDDLEYVTPINDPPPHKTRLPYGTIEETVTTAKMLDMLQYQTFCDRAIREL
jgi:serine/threonine protein kinase